MAAVAAVVFWVWYPRPYADLQGGLRLFWLVVVVDLVCGPLLTMVLWSPAKPRAELARDMALVVAVQVAALVYGVHSVAVARPVYLAYEGDRYRVVSAADISAESLAEAPSTLRDLSWTGPKPLGIKLYRGDDPEFLGSVQDSIAGLHPAFQPKRWLAYDDVRTAVVRGASPLSKLASHLEVSSFVKKRGTDVHGLGFFPVVGFVDVDWIAVVDLRNGDILGFLKLDGWD